MLTTFLNPVALAIAAALVGTLAAGRRGFDAILAVACRSEVVAVVALLGLSSIGSRIVMGYFVPGDFAQEVVATSRFDAEGTLYSNRIGADIQKWMTDDPPPLENRLPETLQTWFRHERDALSRLYSAQAHPPFLLLCARPLVQAFGGYVAFLVMTALTLVATALAAAALLQCAGVARYSSAWWLGIALALAWQPTLAATRHGQVSAVVSGLLIGAWVFSRRGQDVAAGVATGLAAALKVYPALFMLFLLLRRPRACAVALATLVATTIVVVLIAGPAALHAYVTSAAAIAGEYGSTGNNYSLASRFRLMGLHSMVWPAAAAALLLTTAVALFASRHRSQTFDRDAAACVCLVLLASPLAWQHYFFVLLLPVLVVGRAAHAHGSRWSLTLWLIGLLALSIPDAPYWAVLTYVTPLVPPAALVLSPTMAMLAAWVWCLHRWDYA